MLTETVAHALLRLFGVGYLVIAFALMTVLPLCLFAFLVWAYSRGQKGAWYGLLAGCTVAVWASTCWIVIPYCGGYPNLPGIIIGASLFGVNTWGWEFSVHVTNVILWPVLGWLAFRFNPIGEGQANKTMKRR